MNSHSKRLSRGEVAEKNRAKTDFDKLTKEQLVGRLRYAEFMMAQLRDAYREYLVKLEPLSPAHDQERGYAIAMEDALLLITEGPRAPVYLDAFR